MRYFLLLLLTSLGVAAAEPKPCVFCEITAGRLPAAVVYRDDRVMVFMTHAPRNPGHMLVIPMAHAENFLAIPAETMHAMTDVAHRMAEALPRSGVRCEGFNLLMNTGTAADQTVFHAHLHIIPRYTGELPPKYPADILPLAELEAVAAKIRAQLAK